jgi:hypothetical protein
MAVSPEEEHGVLCRNHSEMQLFFLSSVTAQTALEELIAKCPVWGGSE